MNGPAGGGSPGIEVRSPLDGRILRTARITGADEVRHAVERCRDAQREWWGSGARKRARHMRTLARALAARRHALVDVIRAETGKPPVEAMAEVMASIELVRHYLVVAPSVLRTRASGTGWMVGRSAYSLREPYGVVGIITPWNYPLLLTMDSVTAALFAGNGVVAKPSEFTPGTSLELVAILGEADVPEDLVQVVTGDGSTGAALVSGGVDKVVFTGSTATGRKVMGLAAQSLTPVALELGGKDPALVLEDADLDRAAHGVVYGAFFNAGQTCISTERVYVVRSVLDTFLAKVVDAVSGLRVGTGADADIGPITTPAQFEIVRDQLREALSQGARVVAGGEPPPEARSDEEPSGPPPRVLPPTVLADVGNGMRLLAEETFGPLLPVVGVDDEEDAVRQANQGGYGLFASVWTRDLARGERVARRLHAGGVSVNDTLSHYAVPGLSMGGIGESGFGRRRGAEGLLELTRPRSVLVRRWGPRRELWWYPYGPRRAALVEALVVLRARGWVRGLGEAVRVLRKGTP